MCQRESVMLVMEYFMSNRVFFMSVRVCFVCQREFVMLVMEYFMSNRVFFYISESLFCVPERVCYVGDGIFYV